jgi:ubiquinone biosynthesis protein
MAFNKTVKNVNRIREVIKILIKYGFEDIVARTTLRRLVPTKNKTTWTRQDRPVLDYTVWERIRMVIEELGPTFVKLAQSLSNRPDVLPEPLIRQFEKLQDNVPPFDVKIARGMVERSIGKKIDEAFSYFDDKALGSASIGQVHRARLLNGDDVVIKIQRPGAKKQIITDLSLLKDFVKLTETYFKTNGILNPLEIVETFERSMLNELDYIIEARNIAKFRRVYKNNSILVVPKPYIELTTSRVLVMEYVSGCKITDVEQLKRWGLDPKQVAKDGLALYLNQIFEVGFFHADPHPGNVLIKPNGKIILLDYGMVGTLMEQQKFAFANLFISLAQQDARGMAIHLRRLAKESDIDDLKSLEFDITAMIEEYLTYSDSSDTNLAGITNRLQQIIYTHQLAVPGSIFLILRAIAILEGISKVLDPEMDVFGFVKPYGLKILQNEFSFKRVRRDLYYSFSEISSLIYNLPNELRFILRKIRSGKLVFNIEHKGLDQLLKEMDFAVNRLTMSLIIGALLISSSISLNVSNLPSFLKTESGLSLISVGGFGLSGLLMLILFFYSLGSGGKH